MCGRYDLAAETHLMNGENHESAELHKADIVVEYCILTGHYNIMEINQFPFKPNLQPLGY
ncbi:MAG: hypothetical protein ACI4WX_15365 [Aristaeellaceae bacterium]